MTIEQKAKAYDEAISLIKDYNRDEEGFICVKPENIFPELKEIKEREDEKIRKALIDYFDDANKADENPLQSYGIHTDKAIAWLEKQGGQKSIWHNEDEEPKRGSLILLIMQSGTPIVAKIIEPNHTFNHGERWAYIDDLLEKQGEQKHVEWHREDEQNLNACLGYIPDEFLRRWLMDVIHVKYDKPADKVESEFKVGDFIINDYCMGRVVELTNDAYLLDTEQGIPFSCHSTRLWDITKDAEDGDVLVTGDWVFIFEKLNTNGKPVCYCHYDVELGFAIDVNTYISTGSYIRPATKEQRDALMKAMADAGYTFDFEKKELKKIEDEEYNGEDYGIDSLFHAQRILEKTLGKVNGYQTDDGILEHQCAISAVKKLYEQKPTETVKWSAQEEYCICELEAMVREAWGKAENVHNDVTIKKMQELMFFLKTLNPNKKPTVWSEEDKDIRNTIIRDLKRLGGDIVNVKPAYKEEVGWLKSLEQRIGWKPTKEQMEALHDLNLTGGISYAGQGQVLIELYNDLKKL